MLCLIDGDFKDIHYWIGKHGYAVHGSDKLLHRTIAEKCLGRKLKSKEHVHHINYNKLDNRRSNLVICEANTHLTIHARTDCINAGFNPDTHSLCSDCKTYHPNEMFPKSKNTSKGIHNVCRDKSNEKRRGKGYGKFGWLDRLQQQYRRAKSGYTKSNISWITKEGKYL
jgi:hypothetical protein